MDNLLNDILKQIPTPVTRDQILISIQELRMKLLKKTDTDNGDYDRWNKGILEFGNLSEYSKNLNSIIKSFLEDKNLFLSEDESMLLSNQIRNFTINQNLL